MTQSNWPDQATANLIARGSLTWQSRCQVTYFSSTNQISNCALQYNKIPICSNVLIILEFLVIENDQKGRFIALVRGAGLVISCSLKTHFSFGQARKTLTVADC